MNFTIEPQHNVRLFRVLQGHANEGNEKEDTSRAWEEAGGENHERERRALVSCIMVVNSSGRLLECQAVELLG